MKLISEFVEQDIEFLIEEDKKTGKKNYGIQGIFAQAETKNRNGRIYPQVILEKSINKFGISAVLKKAKEKGTLSI